MGASLKKAIVVSMAALAIGFAFASAASPASAAGYDDAVGPTPSAAWGVQLAGNFSKDLALAAFQRARQRYQTILGDAEPIVLASEIRSRGTQPFYRVALSSPTQAEAELLCGKLHSAGASCVVLRS
jgi:hypothetical protein